MPERYRCFKEIDYMFKDLRGRIIEKNQKIKETAHWYIVNLYMIWKSIEQVCHQRRCMKFAIA